MEGKTVLCASVTGTVTLKDDKVSEVSCLYYIFLNLATHSTKRGNADKLRHVNPNGETY